MDCVTLGLETTGASPTLRAGQTLALPARGPRRTHIP